MILIGMSFCILKRITRAKGYSSHGCKEEILMKFDRGLRPCLEGS